MLSKHDLLEVIGPLARALYHVEEFIPTVARRVQVLGDDEGQWSQRDLQRLFVARALIEETIRDLKELRFGVPLDKFLHQLARGEDPEAAEPTLVASQTV
jgi:hypothetical protein